MMDLDNDTRMKTITQSSPVSMQESNITMMTDLTVDCPSSSAEYILDVLLAMRHREQDYAIGDYLRKHIESQGKSAIDEHVDADCRAKMCQWSFSVVEHCDFSKETVAIATNLLDRFLDKTPYALMDRSAFQLAAITSLYTSIKINESQAISLEAMEQLSRDVYSTEQIKAMERMILHANKWLLNPPTVLAFGYKLAEWISCTDSRYPFETLLELTNLQLETALCDYELCLVAPCLVAACAVRNAMESMAITTELEQTHVYNQLCSILDIPLQSSITENNADNNKCLVRNVMIRLYEGLIGTSNQMVTPMAYSKSDNSSSPLISGSIDGYSKKSLLSFRPKSPQAVSDTLVEENSAFCQQQQDDVQAMIL